jgi:Protein of unknown function (DUF1236)
MTNRFLISVAAVALIAGTGFANAQGAGGGSPSAGSPAQHSAPSSERGAASSGTMQHDTGGAAGMKNSEKGSDSSGMKADSEKAAPGASKSAQDTNKQGQKSKSMSSETETKGGKDMKAESRDGKSGNMNAETKSGADSKETKSGADSKTGNMNAQKSTTDSKSQTTTGNAATSATAAPPPEKRTQIVSAIKSERIEETTNVNFNISVGATAPAKVRFHPLPARIVEIYPEWRGYDVIFVHGRYIIVRPQTHEIVYIIEG